MTIYLESCLLFSTRCVIPYRSYFNMNGASTASESKSSINLLWIHAPFMAHTSSNVAGNLDGYRYKQKCSPSAADTMHGSTGVRRKADH